MERRKKSSSRLNGSIFTREERRQRAVNCGDCRQKSSLLRDAVGGGSLLNGQPPPPRNHFIGIVPMPGFLLKWRLPPPCPGQ